MNILEGLILGAIQGVTEFIPVSSSGHLVIAEHFLGMQPSPIFDSLVNLGTFLALLIFFRKRLWDIAVRVFKYKDFRLLRNIIISAVPVVVVGLALKKIIESAAVQSAWVVAATLIILGIVMLIIDRLPTASKVRGSEELSAKRAGWIGLAQTLALIPGMSRSGSTIIAGRLAGLNYEHAAEYSFLLSIPVMFGVVLLGFIGHDEQIFIQQNFVVWALSNITAFVFGMIAIKFMLQYLKKGNLTGFGVYRIALAAVVIITMLIYN